MAAPSAASKLLTRASALQRAAACRQRGESVVFTNGCFDVLHAGHVHYLQAAREAGDVLFVGLNSDASVRTFKDHGRPLNGQEDRAAVLAALGCVDGVILFDTPDPLDLITTLAPDVLVKGADWPEAEIVGADEVKAYGGRVIRIDLKPGRSTSLLIQRILERYAPPEGAVS
ncbi:MAG: D-glycero-beta-D-manno-heptose 1-phosphate adenylyltransferase [Desulfobacterales bacterium]|nr:D-glycero-beta-D-manno-heptose 1-phosphate adenylyltransferase [Desulfobacterales bacterium]MDJ0875470.1 D-glycero-beta-D-manno-heptose 1-phosphate adenylyltransferase [Desulfobacterales bacterium]MDJ0883427.1 D-glycero-beta-D-manno-heptose 1-phosphate adenylyltransferase [Desulfobacterales bacterium]